MIKRKIQMRQLARRALAAALLLTPLGAAAACTISSSTLQLDYGQLNKRIMPDSASRIELPVREVQVRVDCDAPREMKLAFSGSNGSNPQQFSFGRDGNLEVAISALVLDNYASQFIERSPWLRSDEAQSKSTAKLLPGSQIIINPAGQHLSFTLKLHPIFSSSLFAIQDDYFPENAITISLVD
ncbi:hypothetical protein QLG07_15980 [Erwinia sp. V90_4]|uniref:hypothetical protein n=1 Tax=Erwinia sp. V90_4 TaxID=3044239 RepID=UPI00249F634E|nr:hypothetical protein [Erwinia sp. V90_4]MDI3440963.1 hypothetical protein [Erwinia sp. V90_4]